MCIAAGSVGRVMGVEAVVTLHTAAGAAIEPWDLHVGAALNVLGRDIIIKEVIPWLQTVQWPSKAPSTM